MIDPSAMKREMTVWYVCMVLSQLALFKYVVYNITFTPPTRWCECSLVRA